ncbi:MAG: hypothetical protein GXO65_00460 [Euryarchaeota archaeon]|nr:hypothetical protein [Euryarchaeota archaeon]
MKITLSGSGSRCAFCKGSKLLCGKSSCPILMRCRFMSKTACLVDSLDLDGSSPPGVFVGRIGYPRVAVGPLIPPEHGDTSLLDSPEDWVGRSLEEIVSFRSQLVRGKHLVDVHNVEGGGKLVDLTRELAMCTSPADVEARFARKPAGTIALDDHVQPHGPSAPLKELDASSLKMDRKIEKAYYDTDLKAGEAVVHLYDRGTPVSKIQRAFSVGAFGIEDNRRFVPTRWSITAVDDTISKTLVEGIKANPLINEYRVYESWNLDNRFLVIMVPAAWSYELVEAWYPGTTWNPDGKEVAIFSSHEGYHGRSEYAEIGGCYYAARLAVSDHLRKEGRQATVVILREAHPGYIMPVGVWNVRENVREALKGAPRKFDSLKETLGYVRTRLDIHLDWWLHTSHILRDRIYQRRLEDFFQ